VILRKIFSYMARTNSNKKSLVDLKKKQRLKWRGLGGVSDTKKAESGELRIFLAIFQTHLVTQTDVRMQRQVDLKKKQRLERFGGVSETKKADSGELAARLAARAERFALSKGTEGEKPKGGDAAEKPAKPSSAVERKDAAQARAAALVKPAANPEQEAKRQVGVFT
jgi:hypothetical protein